MRTKPSPCTACGEMLDAASVVLQQRTGFKVEHNVEPSSGDMTVCYKCGHIMAFRDDLALRELSVVEIYKIAGDPRLLAIQRARKLSQQ